MGGQSLRSGEVVSTGASCAESWATEVQGGNGTQRPRGRMSWVSWALGKNACVTGAAKGTPVTRTGGRGAGTRACMVRQKDLNFILKGTKRACKGFKQGDGLAWLSMYFSTCPSGRTSAPDCKPRARPLMITAPAYSSILMAHQHTDHARGEPPAGNRAMGLPCLDGVSRPQHQHDCKWQAHLISEN